MKTPKEIGESVIRQITQRPETLDMSRWCGEKQCVGGWALYFAGIPTRLDPDGMLLVYVHDGPPGTHEWFKEVMGCTTYTTVHHTAQHLLGLSDTQADQLFYRTTSGFAAEQLRRYVSF